MGLGSGEVGAGWGQGRPIHRTAAFSRVTRGPNTVWWRLARHRRSRDPAPRFQSPTPSHEHVTCQVSANAQPGDVGKPGRGEGRWTGAFWYLSSRLPPGVSTAFALNGRGCSIREAQWGRRGPPCCRAFLSLRSGGVSSCITSPCRVVSLGELPERGLEREEEQRRQKGFQEGALGTATRQDGCAHPAAGQPSCPPAESLLTDKGEKARGFL